MTTKKGTKSIKGTRTEENLVKAYMAESAAYTRYTYYASQAEKRNISRLRKYSRKLLQTSCATVKYISSSLKAEIYL